MRRLLVLILMLIPQWAWAEDGIDTLISKELFTPSLNDASIGYLNRLFGEVGGLLVSDGNILSTHSLMGELFRIFNSGILMLAGIVMGYTVIITSLGMSQQGEMMMGRGKKASAAVALRVSLGIAMLVPKFSGYSGIQLVVMWVVIQSVGFADSLWSAALDFYKEGGGTYLENQAGSDLANFKTVMGTTSTAVSDMKGISMIFSSLVCMHYHEKTMNIAKQEAEKNSKQSSFAQGEGTPPFDKPNNLLLGGSGQSKQLNVEWGGSDDSWVVRFPSGRGNNSGKIKGNGCGQYNYPSSILNEVDSTQVAEDKFTMGRAVHYVVGLLDQVASDFVNQYSATKYPTVPNNLISSDISEVSNPVTLIRQLWVFMNGSADQEAHPNVTELVRYLRQAVDGYLTYTFSLRLNNQNSASQGFIDLLDEADRGGWILAGRYVRKLSAKKVEYQLNPMGDYMILADSDLDSPTSQSGNLPNDKKIRSAYKELIELIPGYGMFTNQLAGMRKVLSDQSTNRRGSLKKSIESYYSAAKKEGKKRGNMSGFSKKMMKWIQGVGNPINDDIMDMLKKSYTAWVDGVLDSQDASKYDPFSRLAYLGTSLMGVTIKFWQKVPLHLYSTLIDTAMAMAGINAGLSLVAGIAYGSGSNAGYAISALIYAIISFTQVIFQIIVVTLCWYLPLGIAISTPLFVLGVTLGIYVPLMPFLLFLFGAIGWFIAVIEAMVASPLVALGVTHPEGHDLLGKAEQAVMLLLGVFLRAPCMIIGLLSAILLSSIVLNLFDSMFLQILGDSFTSWESIISGGYKNTQIFVAIIGMMIVYTFSLVSALTVVFSLIYEVANRILRWLGMQAEQSAEKQQLDEIKGGVSSQAQAGGQGAGGVASGVQHGGLAPGGAGRYRMGSFKGSKGGSARRGSGGGGGDAKEE